MRLGLVAPATIVSLLLAGCLPLGRASGVLVPADSITLPLADVRKLEAAMHDRIMDGIEFRETVCTMSKKPGSNVKLAARYCTGLDDRREGAVSAHRQARRILDSPDLVQVDGQRVIDLMMRGIGAAVDAAK